MKQHNNLLNGNVGGKRDFWEVVCALHEMLAKNEQVNEATVARRLRTAQQQAEEWLDRFKEILENKGYPEAIRYNEQRNSYEYASDDAAIAVYEDIIKPVRNYGENLAKQQEMLPIDDLLGRCDTQGIVRQLFFIWMMLINGKQVNASVVAKLFRVSERTGSRRIEKLEELLGRGSLRYNRRRASFELVARNSGAEMFLKSLASPDSESSYKERACRPEFLLTDEHYGFEPPQRVLIRTDVVYWLKEAIKNLRKVEIEYHSPNRQTVDPILISPYELRYVHGIWYCVARKHEEEKGCAFELHNINSVKYCDETFGFGGFNAAAFVNQTLRAQGLIEFDQGRQYEIKIHFKKAVAHRILNSVYHETQTRRSLSGGDLLFIAKVRDLDVIKRWVMTFIPYVVSIEPVALRDAVVRDLNSLKLS